MVVDFMEMQNGNGFVPNVGENIEKKLQGKKKSDIKKKYMFSWKENLWKPQLTLEILFLKRPNKKTWVTHTKKNQQICIILDNTKSITYEKI